MFNKLRAVLASALNATADRLDGGCDVCPVCKKPFVYLGSAPICLTCDEPGDYKKHPERKWRE